MRSFIAPQSAEKTRREPCKPACRRPVVFGALRGWMVTLVFAARIAEEPDRRLTPRRERLSRRLCRCCEGAFPTWTRASRRAPSCRRCRSSGDWPSAEVAQRAGAAFRIAFFAPTRCLLAASGHVARRFSRSLPHFWRPGATVASRCSVRDTARCISSSGGVVWQYALLAGDRISRAAHRWRSADGGGIRPCCRVARPSSIESRTGGRSSTHRVVTGSHSRRSRHCRHGCGREERRRKSWRRGSSTWSWSRKDRWQHRPTSICASEAYPSVPGISARKTKARRSYSAGSLRRAALRQTGPRARTPAATLEHWCARIPTSVGSAPPISHPCSPRMERASASPLAGRGIKQQRVAPGRQCARYSSGEIAQRQGLLESRYCGMGCPTNASSRCGDDHSSGARASATLLTRARAWTSSMHARATAVHVFGLARAVRSDGARSRARVDRLSCRPAP